MTGAPKPGSPLVIANVGAEEGPGEPDAPRAAAVRALFAALFDGKPAFDWLAADADAAFAWLNDDAAADRAAAAGHRLAGAPPEAVARVHDKAFTQRVAERCRLVPRVLEGCIASLSSEALLAPDAEARIRERVGAWPAWLGGRFTLKPRIGTSARGRVAGGPGQPPSALAGALPRLAGRGGAILEPWLERDADLSVQLRIDPASGVLLLGTLTQCTAPSGMLAGHRGTVDSRGRVDSAHPEDGALREAACELALAARDAGYHGPCGVDAFVFRGPAGEPLLRPLVELNARFTVGTLAIASVRRAMPVARERFGLAPGRLVHFAFALEPDGFAAPPAVAIEQPGGAVLWLASEPGALDPVFAPPPT